MKVLLQRGLDKLCSAKVIKDGEPSSRSVSADALLNAFSCIERCCREMLAHDGYGEMKIETRILKRGQKEVIVHFGKQYRFVVDQG